MNKVRQKKRPSMTHGLSLRHICFLVYKTLLLIKTKNENTQVISLQSKAKMVISCCWTLENCWNTSRREVKSIIISTILSSKLTGNSSVASETNTHNRIIDLVVFIILYYVTIIHFLYLLLNKIVIFVM